MNIGHPLPDQPTQVLPREAYTDETWLEREQKDLFPKCWTYAGATTDFKETGDYTTLKIGPHPLVLLRDRDGELRAFQNICRHRGTELLEGSGNVGNTIMCPYHRWVYNLDGGLRGLPNKSECFPDLETSDLSLFKASLGVFRGMIFVNPQAQPDEDFESWIGSLANAAWPHDIVNGKLSASDEIVYEMKCNWKVFFENAVDGYHLAYLHEKTLGGPLPHLNTWDVHGRNMVWYSTERDEVRHRVPQFVEKVMKQYGAPTVKGAEEPGYGGVYMLFPTTIIVPNAYSISVSQMVPVDANTTRLHVRVWMPMAGRWYEGTSADIPGYDPQSGLVTSDKWKVHPLETGDFQTEDVWVCEKMQRSLQSPAHKVGALARGAGAEAPLTAFQRNVLDFVAP